MTTTYSGELDPDTGTQQAPGATAFFKNTLYYIGNGHNSTIWVLSRSLEPDSLDPGENPGNERTYWTQSVLDDGTNFKNPIKYDASTSVQPACAVADDNLYFIWVQDDGNSNQPKNSIWATTALAESGSAGGAPPVWSYPVSLADANGDQIVVTDGASFAVTAWGSYLVACHKGDDKVYLLVYDTGRWPSGNPPAQWQASAQWSTSFSDWPSFPAFADLGSQISMDWFTPGVTTQWAGTNAPALYLVISFFNSQANEAYVLHAMDILPLGQWPGEQVFKNWMVEHWTDVGKGVNVVRDPAGRMRAYFANAGDNVMVYTTLATNVVSPDGYSWTTFDSTWNGPFGEDQEVEQAPVPAFVMGPSTTTTTDGTTETAVQAYQFVMFKDGGIRLRFSHFGKAVLIPDRYSMNLGTQSERIVVTGIVDSPLPMAMANFSGQSVADTVGSVTYGSTQSNSNNRSTSWSWSAGFISSGYARAGVTPAWQISFDAGMAGATGHSDTSQVGTALVSSTDFRSAELTPYGNYFNTTVRFHIDEYEFYDLSFDGIKWTNASSAPMVLSTSIVYNNPIDDDSLSAYANTPGDIWSYTKSGWNARMRQLGYPNNNYFDEVILAQDQDGDYINAVVFGTDDSSDPYLGFSWSTSGSVLQSYNQTTSTFEESEWHLDASVYAGVSFVAGANVFGIGEGQFAEFLAGGSYSRSTDLTTTSGETWGITVTYAPPAPLVVPYPGQVTALDFKLYLLKASQQWTTELIQHGNPTLKDQIDPNSAPWRIVFEVDADSVVFQGDNLNLVYRDQNGAIIEAWYYPGSPYSYGGVMQPENAYWSWTDLTQSATEFDGSGGTLPSGGGRPYWFSWGMDQPGSMPYVQAVVFRDANGSVYILWSNCYLIGDSARPQIVWSWRNLAQTVNFVAAAGDPVAYRWEANPWGPSINVIYRGVDGDLHELWANQLDGEWKTDNPTASLPEGEKPASDPCALVWDEDPGGAGSSEHIYYRAGNGQIYEMYYDRDTWAWTPTSVSALSHDHATPTGKPCAFVWNAPNGTSMHVGYRGSNGQIHELRRENNNWQPADDPSYDAHATAADQLAAEGPILGFAWERRAAPQTIHWFYVTGQGAVCELWQSDAQPATWGWNNLGEQAGLPPVAEILQGYAWYFDPANGSSINLYLGTRDGSIYLLSYSPTGGPNSETGVWQATELTGWVTDGDGNPLPMAAGS